VKWIAQGATTALFLNYVQAVATCILSVPGTFRRVPMIGGHIALATLLLGRFWQLEPDSQASVKKYYKHVWDLFYLEYALYTLI